MENNVNKCIKMIPLIVIFFLFSSSTAQKEQAELKAAEEYYNQGEIHRHKGEYDQAISDYTIALGINPSYAEAYCNRGNAYQSKDHYDQAISDYNKALEINPGYAAAYFSKALACDEVGRISEAIEAYRGFIQHAFPEYARYISHARRRLRALESREAF